MPSSANQEKFTHTWNDIRLCSYNVCESVPPTKTTTNEWVNERASTCNKSESILESETSVFSSMRLQTLTVTNPLNVMNHILFSGQCERWAHIRLRSLAAYLKWHREHTATVRMNHTTVRVTRKRSYKQKKLIRQSKVPSFFLELGTGTVWRRQQVSEEKLHRTKQPL